MILATITFTPVMKQNKIHPEWAADRARWFEMIQNVNPTQDSRKRRKGEVRMSWNSRLIGGGPMPTNLLRAPRVLDLALCDPQQRFGETYHDLFNGKTKHRCNCRILIA